MKLNIIEEYFHNQFSEKRICILGFGREGQSSYRWIRKFLPQQNIIIADANPEVRNLFRETFGSDLQLEIVESERYMQCLCEVDVIVKSPGIPFKDVKAYITDGTILTSQTQILLELFSKQIIGITGTKGKSTSAYLLYSIFQKVERSCLLAGNVGLPPLDLLDKISPETIIVCEMSSHQLEEVKVSPHIAILLNVFQEHLDHYESFEHYQFAKYNIALWQNMEDYFIFNSDNAIVKQLYASQTPVSQCFGMSRLDPEADISWDEKNIHFKLLGQRSELKGIGEKRKLVGNHNLINISACAAAAFLHGVKPEQIIDAVAEFRGLAHRLEFIREYEGIKFYNDSISTIPEATIEALKTIPKVGALILGGYDRGIDYNVLLDYLSQIKPPSLVLTGSAGKRIMHTITSMDSLDVNMVYCQSFESAVKLAAQMCKRGQSCLLSPAAASYDAFKNFEERGAKFREIIEEIELYL